MKVTVRRRLENKVAAIQHLWTRASNKAANMLPDPAHAPAHPNLPGEFDEFLEFHADHLPDISVLRQRMYHYGCIIIRSFLPVERVSEFRGLSEHCFQSCVALTQTLRISEDTPVESIADERLREFVRNIRIGQIWPEWFEQFTFGRSIYDLLGPEQQEFTQSLFGGKWFKGTGHVRRVSPLLAQHSKTWQEPIRMHCDGPILSPHTYSINVWAPLDDCGVDAPGLQLVPDAFRPLQAAHRHNPIKFYIDKEREQAEQIRYSSEQDGKRRFRPRLARGDVIMFHNWVMHGTLSRPEMTNPRTSFELRFNAPRRRDFERFAR